MFPDETPLPLKEENGRICCPGVGDDTACLVSLMTAARYVAEHKIKPEGCGILFVCNSGEEGLGNLKGSRQICRDYGDRMKAFVSFDSPLEHLTKPRGWLPALPPARPHPRRPFLLQFRREECHRGALQNHCDVL